MNIKTLYTIIALGMFTLMVVARFSWAESNNRKTFFPVESVDTMKYSRDAARNKEANAKIPLMISAAAALHPTHIAIATPYDDEFLPVMRLWVAEVRKHNIKVWYRGNFAAWEDWFGYGRFEDPSEHLAKTERFIKNNPDLFQDGDIFTPVPEAENGGFGDPRKDEATKNKFFDFLPKSYTVCEKGMKAIGKKVECGYFSVNGDVAHMFTKDIVDRTGGVLVIDHYVKTPEELITDIKEYHNKTGAKIVLGEYGAPIPDIHGDLTQQEQSDLIRQNMIALVKNRDIVGGINYWTAFGGSTEIFEGDDIKPKLAAVTLGEYFDPYIVNGQVVDEFGGAISGATVSNGLETTKTNLVGNYTLMATRDFVDITVEKNDYTTVDTAIIPEGTRKIYTKNIEMASSNHNLVYMIRKFFYTLSQYTHF